jgi:hypothetical protein
LLKKGVMRTTWLFLAVATLGLTAIVGCAASGGDGGGGGAAAGGNSGTGGAGAATTCSPACGSGSVCVASGVTGGAVVVVNDAGTCPNGYHATGGGSCTQDLSYTCMPIPSGCGGTVSCTCASSLCATRMCDGYSNGLLSCVDLVP